eukprot:gene8915-1258_t
MDVVEPTGSIQAQPNDGISKPSNSSGNQNKLVRQSTTHSWEMASNQRLSEILDHGVGETTPLLSDMPEMAVESSSKVAGKGDNTITSLSTLWNVLFGEKTVLPPLSQTIWGTVFLTFVSLFTVYNIFVIPYRAAFRSGWDDYTFLVVFDTLDYIGDCIFLIDIYLNFRCQILHKGILINDREIIAQKYIHGYFPLDLVASLPLDLFLWRPHYKHVLLRLNKFLRIFRVLDRLQEIQHSSRYAMSLELAKLITGIIAISHIIGCGYIAICYADGFAKAHEHGWAPPVEFKNESLPQQYFLAFAWGVKAVTDVGGEDPEAETNLQHMFIIILGFVHIFLIAIVIGSVEAFMEHLNHDADVMRKRVMHLNRYLSQQRLPENLQNRIRTYYYHFWSRKGAFESPDILRELPSNLRTEVHGYTRGRVLAQVPLFKDCDVSFLNELADCIKPRIYAPGDVIFAAGEHTDEIYILNRGEVRAQYPDGLSATYRDGTIMGEVAFFQESKDNSVLFTALTWCDFAALEKDDFFRVCRRYPQELAMIEEVAHARIAQMKLRCALNRHPLLKNTPANFRYDLVNKFAVFVFHPKQDIYKEGELSDAWLFVGWGRVITQTSRTLSKAKAPESASRTPLQSQRSLRRCSAFAMGMNPDEIHKAIEDDVELEEKIVENAFFGGMPLFEEKSRTDSAFSMSKSTVLALLISNFNQVVEEHGLQELIDSNHQSMVQSKHRSLWARNRFKSVIKKVIKTGGTSGFMAAHEKRNLSHKRAPAVVDDEEDEELLERFTTRDRDLVSRVWIPRTELRQMTADQLNALSGILARLQMRINDLTLQEVLRAAEVEEDICNRRSQLRRLSTLDEE